MNKVFAEPAQRLNGLGSAIFAEMDKLRREVESEGKEVINLGIGSPDRAPGAHVRETLASACAIETDYGYTMTHGIDALRTAIANWYQQRFHVKIDAETEVLSLMGSQDGLAHIYTAFINPGDIALIPDPGYPIYTAGLILAGGQKYAMPLLAENNFLPDLSQIPAAIAAKAKLMFINYPNNPVAATADLTFFQAVADFANTYGIMVCHDNAYSELAYDGYRPPSFLQAKGAKDIGIEFHSISKTYNLAGCRLGFAVGNRKILAGLAMLKSNLDYGIFKPVQLAAIAALSGSQEVVRQNASAYQARRDVLVDGLAEWGWHVPKPRGSMFVWAPLPKGIISSRQFALDLLRQTGVVVIPGVAFGTQGEGYVRIALVREPEILRVAVARIGEFLRHCL
ncbi:MAG: aminotransferase class I/II-fold pyridoxal phosphate-dependent enzyme [Peptococcaceae bacterium]|nr:aminotransferase class I/II-fold pyridoxal phosphate-dependent enzyme [Peptococcaceae bacterium]